MKAIVQSRYGGPEVLELRDVPTPDPGPGELLVRVHTTSVTNAQTSIRKGSPWYGRFFIGLTRPKMMNPGTDFSGVVERVGDGVTSFEPGDEVFGSTDVAGGCYAEYVAIPAAEMVLRKPGNISHAEAATILDGAMTALHFLRDKAGLQAGQRVLINGASGSIGTAAVQLARELGAHVTGVCSARNAELVALLGADEVIDYGRADFTQGDRQWDVIFDTVGKRSFGACRGVLTPTGVYLTPVLTMGALLATMRIAKSKRQRAIFAASGLIPAPEKTANMRYLARLLEAGRLRSVIEREYPLDQIPEAHRHVETGHKRGNLAVVVGGR